MTQPRSFFDFSSVRWTIIFVIIAYLFSFALRMIWVYAFKDNPAFYWNDQLMINTNDGYYFASGVQKALLGMHQSNPLVPGVFDRGVTFVTTILAKITPFSLETIILYMPALFSSLIVVPIVLIGKLYRNPIWGFLSALLASVTWSYYNRTMIGYYDSDMFAIAVPMFVLYFLLKSLKQNSISAVFWASIVLSFYEFLYLPGKTVANAMVIMYILYLVYLYFFEKKNNIYFKLSIMLFVASSSFYLPIFTQTVLKILLLIILYTVLKKNNTNNKFLIYSSLILLIYFLFSSDAVLNILHRIMSYARIDDGNQGLHFYSVVKTVREAGRIPFEVFADRISGSRVSFILAAIGYAVLLWRHKAFWLSLPLVGIGMFAYWGGLRFTVYAVPVAAMSVVYLFWVVGEYIGNKKAQYGLTILATLGLLYPNYLHIKTYKVPTVFNKSEVSDLDKLSKISKSKDYTLTWWDYGYPIWFYSDTSTLLDGSKHNDDNFIVSTIMQTESPAIAARLSRLAVETYAGELESYKKYIASGKKEDAIPKQYRFVHKDGQPYHTADLPAADVIFRNGQPDQKDPNLFLSKLSNGLVELPPKTRNIYLGMPMRMMNIFPTIMVFGNINLSNGQPKRKVLFSSLYATKVTSKNITFGNGYVLDTNKGILHVGMKSIKIDQFVITENSYDDRIKLKTQRYHMDGQYTMIYMSSYKRFVLVDRQTFRSMYVQMFILGKYDPKYFEPVVMSPYSRVYKLKI